ncbi:MAG: hypothetical protein COT24_03790 [Candidatus Kerfeldbacteria bacterium CG08_land_8_20_14_0_20_40_16]|uniref:Uncharacterized protein n=1 Tax=Candidatus Kerfeldbacteria bacterium CG08_land_8_20_14_0_20_40_16 TaxID=2014244 RepID=A0A2H0YVE5_9BACT|nr:MAG: hypothetical protein COT24_03790 [Candidatus Kerfeldbacteria bacterium CG08_land_8_20_14_0_20_40_16]
MRTKCLNFGVPVTSINYFYGKLFDINYRISVHEGNANQRLASEAAKILYQLGPSQEVVPRRYREEFSKLVRLIEATIKSLPQPGLTPTRLKGIKNKTAVKYIKMLIDIQNNFQTD